MNDRSRTRGGPAGNYVDPACISPVLNTTLELAARAAGHPIAVLYILDDRDQHALAAYGIEGVVGSVTDRQCTASRAVVDTGRPVVISDADDPRIDPSLTAPLVANGLRTYVGVPLFSREHTAIGTLCVTDTVGRDSGPEEVEMLQKYASVIEEQLELQRDRTVATDNYSIEEIIDAMSSGEIRPWFQAIVDPRTRRTHGYEALCRWMHPTDGVLSPGRFLPAVRSTDIMLDLDLAILRQAMDVMVHYDATEHTVLHANIAGAHLIRPERIEMLTAVITASAYPAARLRLELVESASLDDNGAAHAISTLRAIGGQVVIDDVGRGWSSLSRMVTWPIDGFKIDASLTSGLGTSVVDHLLTGLIEHGNANDLVVIAEGIETPEQVRSLVALQCPLAQGFHFQVPQPDPHPA